MNTVQTKDGFYLTTNAAASYVAVSGLFFASLALFVLHGPASTTLLKLFESATKTPTAPQAAKRQSVYRIVGAVHVAVQLPLALYVMSDPLMWIDRLHATTHTSYIMLGISSGYFLFDLIDAFLRLQEEGVAYLIHGLCCFTLYSYAMFSGFLHLYGAGFLMWELSTPCVYVRWFLYKLGKTDTKAYVVNGLAMMVTFFLCRNVLGTVMSVDFFRVTSQELAHPREGRITAQVIWLYRFGNVVLNCLNWVWFSKMLRGAIKIFGNQPIPKGFHEE